MDSRLMFSHGMLDARQAKPTSTRHSCYASPSAKTSKNSL